MGTNEKNMTSGSPGKLIITFAIPLMLGNIFQQFYTMADTMIVGQVVGVEALAAVGAGDWLVWLVFGIMTGNTQGFSILVAQFYGAREKENLKCAVAKSYIIPASLRRLLPPVLQPLPPVRRSWYLPSYKTAEKYFQASVVWQK